MDAANKLTPAQAERLAMLIEEYGEIIQAATKVLRHGYESRHPDRRETNRDDLAREVADLGAVLSMMTMKGDLDLRGISEVREARFRKLRFAHHQDDERG